MRIQWCARTSGIDLVVFVTLLALFCLSLLLIKILRNLRNLFTPWSRGWSWSPISLGCPTLLVGTLSGCAHTMHVTCDLEISDIILFTHLSGTSKGGAVGLSDHWVADTEHLWRSSADVGISPRRMHKQLHFLPHYDRMRGRSWSHPALKLLILTQHLPLSLSIMLSSCNEFVLSPVPFGGDGKKANLLLSLWQIMKFLWRKKCKRRLHRKKCNTSLVQT